MFSLRHGDVKFLSADAYPIPGDMPRRKPHGDRYRLVEGEATGHYHWVEARPDVEVFGPVRHPESLTDAFFLRVGSPVLVSQHGDDHAPVELVAGEYWIVSDIREYTPERIRRMAD